MRCYSCGGTYEKKHGKLDLSDDSIGFYSVCDVDYHKCDRCDRLLYPSSTVDAIEQNREKIFNEYIQREAVGNFISASETANILEISGQALSKNRRIRRGFIYGIKIGKITLYHKKSVELFKCAGDGRFNFDNKMLPKSRIRKNKEHMSNVK